MTTVDWRSLHVVYYEDNKDGLVLDGVRPLFRRLAGHVPGVSYTRHWRLGPHLRLNFRCDAATMAGVVRPAADDVLGRYLASTPSTARLDPEAHLPMHRRLAAMEREQGRLMPWRPDNSIHEAPWERRLHVLNGPDAAGLLADFYADTTDLAFTMTEMVVAGRQRSSLAFDLLIATAHGLSGVGLADGSLSLRAHAEGFFAEFPGGEEHRAGWDAHFRRHGGGLPARIERVLKLLDSGAAGPLSDWVAVLASYRRRAEDLLAAGRLAMPHPGRGVRPEVVARNEFLRVADPGWFTALTAPWFVRWRLMLNYTYLHLTRLGITPMERFLLCYLASRAVEEHFGVPALRRISEPPPVPAGTLR